MYNLIIKQPDSSDKIVAADKATLEEIVQWINQASDFANRQKRKQMMYCRLYSNPQPFSEFIKSKPPAPP